MEVLVSPNPFQDWLEITVNSDEKYFCQIFSGTGQIVWAHSIEGEDVFYPLEFDSGVYFLSIQDAKGRIVDTEVIVKID